MSKNAAKYGTMQTSEPCTNDVDRWKMACRRCVVWSVLVLAYATGAALFDREDGAAFIFFAALLGLSCGVLGSAAVAFAISRLGPAEARSPVLDAFVRSMPWFHGPWLLVGPATVMLTAVAILIGLVLPDSSLLLLILLGIGFPLWIALSVLAVYLGSRRISRQLCRHGASDGLLQSLVGWAWIVGLGSTLVGFGGMALGVFGAIDIAAHIGGFDPDPFSLLDQF